MMSQKSKSYMLPLAMIIGIVTGIILPEYVTRWATLLTPALIFIMLLITYCKASLHEMRFSPMHGWLLAIQIIGGLAIFGALYFWDSTIAEGVFICLFCPTATAAPVITGMLGGSIPTLISYSLLSNMAVALFSPIVFSFMGKHADISFIDSFLIIGQKVLPLLLLPLIVAFLLWKLLPQAHQFLKSKQSLTFYLWIISLTLIVGKATTFIIEQGMKAVPLELAIAGLSLVVCVAQFYIGRKIGKRYGDKIAGAQGLGQKNTVLAIWLALTYLSPITSIGPASYIIWQNSINSLQLYLKDRKNNTHKT